jgi:hypothetical protein
MIWLWLYLTIPSLNEVHKYSGWPGVAIYLGLVAAALWLASRSRWAQQISPRQAIGLATATFLALATLFIAIYPIAQSLRLGPGSDSDDSVNIAVTELLHGRYPYYVHTYLGNAVHEMPGMLLLATPFVLLGNSAYMNLFWLPVFFFIGAQELADTRRALLTLWMILAFCPIVMQQIVTGGDSLANSLFAAVSLWLVMRAKSRSARTAAAVLLGLALSSRANFLLVIPTALLYVGRKAGWPRAIYDFGLAVATFLVVTLPFYLHDPAHFTPLEGATRLTRFNAIVPHLGEAIGVAGLLLALWLGWRSDLLFPSCALVQGFFAVTGAILSGDLGYAAYGIFSLFFAMLYPWKVLIQPQINTDKHG